MSHNNDFFDDFWKATEKFFGPGSPFAPIVPHNDTGDGYSFQIEVPGIKKENLKVEVNGENITVSGKRGDQELKRIFDIPLGADPLSIDAHLEDGVLELRFKKQKIAGPRLIPIK